MERTGDDDDDDNSGSGGGGGGAVEGVADNVDEKIRGVGVDVDVIDKEIDLQQKQQQQQQEQQEEKPQEKQQQQRDDDDNNNLSVVVQQQPLPSKLLQAFNNLNNINDNNDAAATDPVIVAVGPLSDNFKSINKKIPSVLQPSDLWLKKQYPSLDMEKIFMAQPPEPSEKPSEKPSPIKLPSPKILPPKKISRSPSLKPRRSLKKIQKITEKTRKKRARPKKSLNISSTYKETMANDDKLLLSVEKDNSVVFKVRRNRTRNRTRDRRRTRQRAIVNKTPSVTLAKCLKNPRKSIRKIESLRTPSMILMAAMNDADSIKKLITIMSKHNNFNNNNEMEKSRKKIDGRRQRRKKVDDNDDKEETIRSLLTRIDNNEKSRKNKTRQKDIHSLSSMIFRKNQRPMSKIFCSDTKQQQQQPQQQQQQQQQRKYSLLMMKRLAKRRATTSSYPRTLIKAIENFLQNYQ